MERQQNVSILYPIINRQHVQHSLIGIMGGNVRQSSNLFSLDCLVYI